MKSPAAGYTRLSKALCCIAFAMSFHAARAQSTAFTYQGELVFSGVPVNQSMDFIISLYATDTGSGSLASETKAGVVVTNGRFTITALSFGVFISTNADRWIEIQVKKPTDATYTTLTPRQKLTASPYAFYAKNANSAVVVTGSVPAGQITGTLNPSILANGSLSSTLNFAPPSGSPFTVNGSTKVLNLNSDLLDGLDSGAFVKKAGDTMTGNLNLGTNSVTAGFLSATTSASTGNAISGVATGAGASAVLGLASGAGGSGIFGYSDNASGWAGYFDGRVQVTGAGSVLDFGSTTRQMLNLWGSQQYGVGVQSGTLYQRTGGRFSWFKGGLHTDLEDNAGTGGTRFMTLTDSLLQLRPGVTNGAAGQGPITLSFGDVNATAGSYVSIGEADTDDEMDIVAKRINLKSNGAQAFQGLHFGTLVGQSITLYQNATDNYGIGVQGFTEYFRTGDRFAWYKDGSHNDNAGSPGAGGTTLMTLAADGNLFIAGALSTSVMTIRGGADIAEPFQMSEPEAIEEGSVVIIDETSAGKLKLSSTAYDRRVAGIVSGAGGVKPGLRLQQDGVIEGGQHVALSGRVYVKADAAEGAIKPGDLLTTSSTAGHAMKVSDHANAQGAILGKAMSSLDNGTGLVLVLVTLQ